MRTRRRGFGSAQTWFTLAAVGTFVYGVETWRSRASARASQGEHARFRAAVTCLLGDDGVRLAYSPGEARKRLRALAMDTPLEPAPTWIDRCIPLLRDLAVHGAEVDVTQDPRGAPTAVARHARELALFAARVGLVWQVRAGDPDTDMDHVADALVRTATEIDLASSATARGPAGAVRAPAVRPMPAMARLATGGLLPLPVGTPSRFLVGAPLPFVSAVDVTPGALRASVVANDDARWWRVVPGGVVRIAPEDGAPDGLSPVRLDTVEGAEGTGRIAAPPPRTDPRAVALDAVARGRVLWLAESVRGRGAVLARLPFARGGVATAASLSPGAREGTPEAERFDEDVAVGVEGAGVVAAYTEHVPGAGLVAVRVVRAAGGERAAVRAVPMDEPWYLRGRRPGVALCTSQGTSWVFAAGQEGWRAGVLRGGRVVDAGRVERGSRRFDETLTVRCGRQGAVVYGREHPRASPLWRCTAPVDGASAPACEALPLPPSSQPGDLDPWSTVDTQGRRHAHAEWPLAFALTGRGTVLAVRAAGTVAAAARLPYGASAWEPERVVFDAAADEPGATVLGAEVYSDGARALLVVSTASELRAAASDDDGAAWRAP